MDGPRGPSCPDQIQPDEVVEAILDAAQNLPQAGPDDRRRRVYLKLSDDLLPGRLRTPPEK